MFGVRDQLNYPDSNLMQLFRPVLYHREERYSRRYDPYYRIYEARETGGWIVDYTHAVQDELVVPNREITPAELGARLKAVTRVGGAEVWLATPEEVVDYILMSRGASICDFQQTPEAITYRLAAPAIPERVQSRTLTFSGTVPAAWEKIAVRVARGDQVLFVVPERIDETRIRFSHQVYDGQQCRIAPEEQLCIRACLTT